MSKALLFTLIGMGILLFVGALGAAGYFFKENKDLKKNPNAAAESEQSRIMSKVGALYNTPNEEPSLIQVQDPSKIKNQAFFKDAQKGDYVLVYQQSKLAIMYREKTNKIVNTGPIVLDEDSTNSTTGDSTSTLGSSAKDSSISGTTNVKQ